MEVAHREVLLGGREGGAHASWLEVAEGDMIFFAAAPWEKACAILGQDPPRGRRAAPKARQARAIRPDDWKFLWVVDFPLMTFDEEQKRYVATHHPFTSPVPEDIARSSTRARRRSAGSITTSS